MEIEKFRWGKKELFCKGNLKLMISGPKLAVVGSRRMSEYGKRVIEKWMPVWVQKNVIIVSGFMYGVDQAAHSSCIDNGGKTIAVLGWGINKKPVSEDEKLYHKLLERDGLMVSEWGGEEEGTRWTFPERNEIVAGMSDAVLVVEADLKSGSLITARLATKYRKKLMAVPGQVGVSVARGTNWLVKSGKAVMVTSAEEVLEEMGLSIGQMKMELKLGVVSKNPIVEVLRSGPKRAEEMAKILGIKIADLMADLGMMEIEGIVIVTEGRYFLV